MSMRSRRRRLCAWPPSTPPTRPLQGAPLGGAGSSVFVYDTVTDELIEELKGAAEVVSVAVFEVKGAGLIAAGYKDGSVKIWDAGDLAHPFSHQPTTELSCTCGSNP